MGITQKELLEKEFKAEGREIFGGILRPGLYVLAGNSKIGKTLVATTLANCVALGKDYLGKSMPKGKVIYFDNDNYDFEAKARILALQFDKNEDILYEFNEARSIQGIKFYLDRISNIAEYRLVIIDCYVNLSEVATTNDSYNDVYPLIKELRDIIVNNNLVGIFIHHTKKEVTKSEQDNVIGSKALTGATTGTLLLSVGNEYSQHGKLKLILRNNKTIINIKKDKNNINWILDDSDTSNEEIPKNILFLINTVVAKNNHKIVGTCQEIVQLANLDINPNYLTKYLKEYRSLLLENHVTFKNERTGTKRLITIQYQIEDN